MVFNTQISSELLNSVVSNTPIPMLIKDIDGKWLIVNQALCRLLNMTQDALLQKKEKEILSKSQLRIFKKWDKALLKSEKKQTYEASFKKNGPVYNFQKSLLKENDRKYILVCIEPQVHHIEQIIKGNENKYRTLYRRFFEYGFEGIAVIDSNSIEIVEANQKLKEYLKLTANELHQFNPLISTPLYQANGIKSSELIKEHLKTTKRKGKVQFDWISQNKEKDYQYHEISLINLPAPNEHLIAAIFKDITEKTHNEKERQRLFQEQEAIIASIPAAFFFKDTLNNVVKTNKTGADLLGLTKEQIENNNFSDLMPEYAKEFLHQDFEVARSRKPMLGIIEHLTVNNEKRWVRTDKSPFIDEKGYITGVLSYSIDITDLIDTKEELELAQKTLMISNQQLDEKNRQLKTYIDSNMQLENFAYIASHDLKEPLRTITSFTQIIEETYAHEFDEMGKQCLKYVITAAKNLNLLIEDLLIFSKVGSEQIDMRPINMHILLDDIVQSLNMRINETKAEIILKDIPETILGNMTRIRQLFQNLIANAIKFHKKDINPIVKLSCTELKNAWQFRVEDNGIGIKPEYHEKIFLLFKKLHNKSQYEGTGIGLALCKKITELHEGQISLESIPNDGTTFIFTISKTPSPRLL